MPDTVCWYVQSHRDPEQIARLLRVLREGSDRSILLRHDEAVTPLDPASLLALGNVHLLPAAGHDAGCLRVSGMQLRQMEASTQSRIPSAR
ncbi:MAG: hypothetical protein ACSLFQ_02430 [Thermoanaerobaculia bacterium]